MFAYQCDYKIIWRYVSLGIPGFSSVSCFKDKIIIQPDSDQVYWENSIDFFLCKNWPQWQLGTKKERITTVVTL